MHVIEKDIKRWSKEILEVPSKELNNLPACPYAKQVWKNKTYKFDINDKFNTLKDCVNKFVNGNYNNYQIVIWTSYEYPDSQQYFEGYLEGYNESLAIAGKDIYLMGFHPDFDAEEANLAFLNREYDQEEENEYAMVFVQKLSEVNQASKDLEKKGYYKNFPVEIYNSLILDRRRLQNGYES
jgi:hypothetical protein